jgi:hypothetical protein
MILSENRKPTFPDHARGRHNAATPVKIARAITAKFSGLASPPVSQAAGQSGFLAEHDLFGKPVPTHGSSPRACFSGSCPQSADGKRARAAAEPSPASAKIWTIAPKPAASSPTNRESPRRSAPSMSWLEVMVLAEVIAKISDFLLETMGFGDVSVPDLYRCALQYI